MSEQILERQVELSTGVDIGREAQTVLDGFISRFFYGDDVVVSPWWSRSRDRELRMFWKDGQQGSGIMFRAQNKLASIPFKIVARDKSIMAHVRQAEVLQSRIEMYSGFMSGLNDVMLKFSEDYLGQDNGAFMEILGEGDPAGPIDGPVYGFRHLDSQHCQRTGDPVYPVIYHAPDGRLYKFHQARLVHLSQMPSADQTMHGVGMSSVSRSLRILENLQNVLNYKDEKMGAKAAAKLLVGSGITGLEITKAMAASEAIHEQLGLTNMVRTTAIGSTSGDVKVDVVDLNNLDPFNEETTYTYAAYALAIAWGLEFNEVIPLQSGRVSDIASLQRARSMLPQSYREAMEQQLNIKIVPPHLKVQLDYQDDLGDQQRAIIEDITSRNYSRQIDSGYTTPLVVQEQLCERGYVSKSQLNNMKLEQGLLPDNSPVQTTFFDPKYDEFFLIDKTMLSTLTWGKPEQALALIEANISYIYELIGNRRSSIFKDRAMEALAALGWLEKRYGLQLFRENDSSGEGEESPASDEESADDDPQGSKDQDGKLSNSESGEGEGVGKATDFFSPGKIYSGYYSSRIYEPEKKT